MNVNDKRIAWGDEINGLRLGISMWKKHYTLGEKSIVLEIYVANVSTRKIQIIESHILLDYDVEILMEGDRLVPMTPDGDKARRAAITLEPSRRIVVEIEPSTVHKVNPPVRLDEWFHLDETGVYAARVRRRDWQGEKGLLTSGSMIFYIASSPLEQ